MQQTNNKDKWANQIKEINLYGKIGYIVIESVILNVKEFHGLLCNFDIANFDDTMGSMEVHATPLNFNFLNFNFPWNSVEVPISSKLGIS